MKPRALVVRKVRDGYTIHLSNTPMPRKFAAAIPVADAIFDLEMEGYDVSRIARMEARKENAGGRNGQRSRRN